MIVAGKGFGNKILTAFAERITVRSTISKIQIEDVGSNNSTGMAQVCERAMLLY